MTQWYYTKAGEQQGPITLDELKGLFASGALDPDQDLVWTTTMSDWVPISQVPEITSGEPVPAQEQLQQPFAYPTATGAFEEIEAGTEPIIPTACVKRAFDLTVRNLGPLVVVMLVVVGITFAADFILEMLRVAIVGSDAAVQYNTVGSDNLSASQSQLSAAETVMVLVLNIISSLITLFLTLGGLRISLNVVSGKPFTVGMLFGQGDKMVRAFFAQILFAIMVGVGLIFLIVPGVYLALRYGSS